MVKTNSSSPCCNHSALELPNSNNTSAPIERKPNRTVPISANHGSYPYSANMGFPRYSVYGVPVSKTGLTNEVCRQVPFQPPLFQTLLHEAISCPKEPSSVHGTCEKAVPTDLSGSAPKKLLIFDRSGNQTRLVLDPPFYDDMRKPAAAAVFMKPVALSELHNEALSDCRLRTYLTKPITGEEVGENHIIGETSEMHEDTKEIDALLYSDSDEDDEEDVDDDDDAISTGHSPTEAQQVGLVMEEVATSGGPIKKQRLLDDGGGESCLVKLVGRCEGGGDAESKAGCGRKRGCREDEICGKLEILKRLVMGGKGRDPVLVLDEAIKCLISLKVKAKAQGTLSL